MPRQAISDTAARHLEKWLDQLVRGDLRLGDLPLPVEAFFHAGWAEGMAHAAEQARQYEHKLDRAYLWAFTDKDKRAEYQRRLDHHFRLEDVRFFAEEESTDDRSIGKAAA